MDGNRDFFDQVVRYQVFLERYKNGSVRRLRDFLLDLDADLAQSLERHLDGLSARETAILAGAGSATTARLKALREFFDDLARAANAELLDRVIDEITPVGERKARRTIQATRVTTGLVLAMPSIQRIETSLRTDPFQGRVLKEYTKDWSEARTRRVLQALRIGLAQGESTESLVKRIRGTKSRGYRDGILEVSRRGAATIARTAANHMVTVADNEVAKRNADKIEVQVWTSVLDGRTSSICRVNDGREFPPGEAVGIPAHLGCRSWFTPRFKDQGTVPADERYSDWIKRQPRDVQVEAIGSTRAKLLREGGLGYDDLVNQATGREYTLDQLRDREARAFDAI